MPIKHVVVLMMENRSFDHMQAMSNAATADEAFNESLAHFNAFVDKTSGKRSV